MSSIIDKYNDIGGAQGNASFSMNGSSRPGANDMINVNPLYVNSAAAPPNYHLQSGSPLMDAGEAGLLPLTTSVPTRRIVWQHSKEDGVRLLSSKAVAATLPSKIAALCQRLLRRSYLQRADPIT
jgi:hypothetical protein